MVQQVAVKDLTDEQLGQARGQLEAELADINSVLELVRRRAAVVQSLNVVASEEQRRQTEKGEGNGATD